MMSFKLTFKAREMMKLDEINMLCACWRRKPAHFESASQDQSRPDGIRLLLVPVATLWLAGEIMPKLR
jgi:hypothetical protein